MCDHVHVGKHARSLKERSEEHKQVQTPVARREGHFGVGRRMVRLEVRHRSFVAAAEMRGAVVAEARHTMQVAVARRHVRKMAAFASFHWRSASAAASLAVGG